MDTVKLTIQSISFSGDAETGKKVLQSIGAALNGLFAPTVPVTSELLTAEEPADEISPGEQEAIEDAFPVRLPAGRRVKRAKKAARISRPAAYVADDPPSPDELAERILDAIRLDGPQTVPQLAVRFQKHSIAIGKCVAKYAGMFQKNEAGEVCLAE